MSLILSSLTWKASVVLLITGVVTRTSSDIWRDRHGLWSAKSWLGDLGGGHLMSLGLCVLICKVKTISSRDLWDYCEEEGGACPVFSEQPHRCYFLISPPPISRTLPDTELLPVRVSASEPQRLYPFYRDRWVMWAPSPCVCSWTFSWLLLSIFPPKLN
jgi:hypothetical protein